MEIMKSLRPKVVPPEGWVADTREGTLRRDASGAADGGLLARLDAVVRFLMERDSLPCSEVVKVVCADLEADPALVLYMVQQQGLAMVVTDRTRFDSVGVGGSSGRAQRAGCAGAIEAMRCYWGSEPACSVYEAAGLDCLAVPLWAACKVWGYGQMQTLRPMWPLSMSEVQWDVGPLESWMPNAPNGLLRHGPGDECRLVRLVEVAAWMANEYPRNEVIRRLFGALYQNEADPWGWQLFVLNGKGYAQRLIRHFGPSPETVDFWQYLREPDSTFEYPECVTSEYGAQDVIGVIVRMWEYAWPGVSADPDADRDWYLARVKSANLNHRARVNADPNASSVPAPATMLSEERKEMMRVLERLAVPIPIAFTLWGWGRAAAPVALPGAVAGAQAAPAAAAVIEVQDVTDWPSLVLYRLQFASVAAQKRPVWLPGHVAILAARLHEEHQAGRGRGALGRLAGELGSVRSTVGELLKKHDFNQATGEKLQAPATPWSGMGGRGGKAA